METNALVGIDCAVACLYRSLGLRRYLKKISQTESPLFKMTLDNIRCAHQNLQLFCDDDGSYSMFPDTGTHRSSLYLTSLVFGAMISSEMPIHDNATLNLTLTWILSQQQENGSFDDNSPCFHHRFCATEFRRESLTAIVVLALTRDDSPISMPECIHDRLFGGKRSPIRRAYDYLELHVADVKQDLIRALCEMVLIQQRDVSSALNDKLRDDFSEEKLTVVPEDGSKYINIMDDKMTFDDQLLFNAMALSIYNYFQDWPTISAIARWIINQIEIHPHYDQVLDAVLYNKAWLDAIYRFHEQLQNKQFAITVNVSSDSGEERKFTINSTNMDVTQKLRLKLPVRQITYSVSGFGIATVIICEKFIETEQKVTEPMPFTLTQELTPMPCITEIKAKTCVTYTPTSKDLLLASENFNRTMVVEIKLPSGLKTKPPYLNKFKMVYF